MLKWIKDFAYKVENKAAESEFIYRLTSGYYQDVIQKEIVLANITAKDHILCIGGGICPFSAILFHQLTGAKVTVIYNNENRVPKAKEVITRLGINEKVRVFHQDGKDITFANYTIVHLALQVSPMEQVFNAVEQQIVPGTKLLVRRPKRPLGNLYSKLASALSNCPYAAHKSRNIGSTVLYIKQDTVVA